MQGAEFGGAVGLIALRYGRGPTSGQPENKSVPFLLAVRERVMAVPDGGEGRVDTLMSASWRSRSE